MSEQAKIIAKMQELIMNILKTGAASVAEGDELDELEEELNKQKSFQEIKHPEHSNKGELIAALFLENYYDEAIEKMCEFEIIPEDFFGFAEYHFEEEETSEMFTESFIQKVTNSYKLKSESK